MEDLLEGIERLNINKDWLKKDDRVIMLYHIATVKKDGMHLKCSFPITAKIQSIKKFGEDKLFFSNLQADFEMGSDGEDDVLTTTVQFDQQTWVLDNDSTMKELGLKLLQLIINVSFHR